MSTERIERVRALVVGNRTELSEAAKVLLDELAGSAVRTLGDLEHVSDQQLALHAIAAVHVTASGLAEILDGVIAEHGEEADAPKLDALAKARSRGKLTAIERAYALALDEAIRALDTHGVVKLRIDHPNEHVRHLSRLLAGLVPIRR